MRSHSIPRKLLEQFSYDDTLTNSSRLWRYQSGREPLSVSPASATRWDGYFADPQDEARENQLEKRLQRDFEDPVNEFIESLRFSTFVLSLSHIRRLSAYVTLLFNRSRSRKVGTVAQLDLLRNAFKKILENDDQLEQLAVKETLNAARKGIGIYALSKEEIALHIKAQLAALEGDAHLQHVYADTIETMMGHSDENLGNGRWNIVRTTLDDPFVLGDSPVITWDRINRETVNYGKGFGQPDVEVFLPVSPVACLHILPLVPRTKVVMMPRVDEINKAQAAFAFAHVFSHVQSAELDQQLQPNFGLVKIGENAFSLKHMDYSDKLFQVLMDQ